MSDQEISQCDICGTEAAVERKYYHYPITCDCCNGEKDNHFEIVYFCSKCTPKPPRLVTCEISPLD